MDLRTLLFANLLTNIAIAAMLAIYWRTQKTYPGFGHWALGSVGIAAAFLLFSLKSIAPEFYTVILANTAAMTAVVFRHIGVRRFWGQGGAERPLLHVGVIAACALLLSYYTLIDDNPLISLILVTAGISAYSLGIAYDMTKGIRLGYPIIAKTIALIYVLYAATMIGRLCEWELLPDIRCLLTPSFTSILYFSALLMLEVASALLFMMLNSQRLSQSLWLAQQQMAKLAATDPLTGLYNRRKLIENGEAAIERTDRLNLPCSLLLIDLDHLKRTNDTCGHSAGDALLLNVVAALQSQLGENDILGRLGGDEFVLLLPNTALAQAQKIAAQLRLVVQEWPFVWENRRIPMSISIGAAEYSRFDAGWTDWLQRADLNLYQEKNQKQAEPC